MNIFNGIIDVNVKIQDKLNKCVFVTIVKASSQLLLGRDILNKFNINWKM